MNPLVNAVVWKKMNEYPMAEQSSTRALALKLECMHVSMNGLRAENREGENEVPSPQRRINEWMQKIEREEGIKGPTAINKDK